MLNNKFIDSLKPEPHISGPQNFLFVFPFITLIDITCGSNSALYISHNKN
jgi:hypothetical protein